MRLILRIQHDMQILTFSLLLWFMVWFMLLFWQEICFLQKFTNKSLQNLDDQKRATKILKITHKIGDFKKKLYLLRNLPQVLGLPVGKNQILNTKCQPKFFVIVTIWKEKRQPGLFSFQNAMTIIIFGWHLVCIIWCLVVGFQSPIQWKGHLIWTTKSTYKGALNEVAAAFWGNSFRRSFKWNDCGGPFGLWNWANSSTRLSPKKQKIKRSAFS